MNDLYEQIAQKVDVSPEQVAATLLLTKEGNTIPFIARYRKEKTGNLDELAIKAILDTEKMLTNLAERREVILTKIAEQGKLTDALKTAIEQAEKLAELEELYLPYKEKRKTKASIAKENGLTPLARLMLQQDDVEKEATQLINEVYPTTKEVLSGAIEILAEALSEDSQLRSWTYQEIRQYSRLHACLKDAEKDSKGIFEIYYDFSEKIHSIQGYQTLALHRGEKLGVLTLQFDHQLEKMQRFFATRFPLRNSYVGTAITQALKKKILPSLERRIRSDLFESAEEGAIQLFSDNLRHLLLTAPLKGRRVLGFDPAFRTGAKLAVVDETGKLLATQVIYPVLPAKEKQIATAKKTLAELISAYHIEIIAIGNGTASRESEQFVAEVLTDFPQVSYVIVNESGASVYSASELARTEFPDLPVEKRSAISIARRLQDPLAELVKIDPKSIGVGQYQHDVSQKKLSESLDFVVEMVVNQVGVNINTASSALLAHVAGLNRSISENIVRYREEKGKILSRTAIKEIPRLGEKAFKQAAGFLRIPESKHFLDNTGVHPESYKVVEQLFSLLQITELTNEAKEQLKQLSISEWASKLEIGEATLTDIIADLLRPGRDLRDSFDAPILRQDVLTISDLEIGQKLEGVVRNIVDFGAFVDIGVHKDGLIHITKLSQQFVRHPSQILSVGDLVTVWVDQLDKEREKVNLSLFPPNATSSTNS